MSDSRLTLYSGISLFALLVILTARKWVNNSKPVAGQPARALPQLDPFLGLDVLVKTLRHIKNKTMLDSIYQNHQNIGRTYSFVIFGQRCIETIEPANIKAIHQSQFKDFNTSASRYGPMKAVLGEGVFTSDGHVWKLNRSLLRPYFSRSHLLSTDRLEHYVSNFISRISDDGSPVQFQSLSFDFTMDITTEFLFGRSLNILSGANPELQNIADTLDAAEDLMGQRARCGFFYPLVGTRRLEHLAKVLHGFVDSCIKDAAADIATKTHNEQQLKAITDEQRQSTYNKLLDEVVVYDLLTRTSDLKQIRVNLMALIVAGRDSLAASVSMFFYAVSRQPAIWEKLQEEVITTFGAHGIPEMSEIRRLKYLKQVYDETLRLYPPLPWNPRVAVDDIVLPTGGGLAGDEPLLVHKGTLIAFSTWSLHRDKANFGPDADKFNPERWEKLSGLDWCHFIPFGAGQRRCIGQEFATNAALYLIVRLLQNFSGIRNHDDKPFQENLRLTLASQHDVEVSFIPRVD